MGVVVRGEDVATGFMEGTSMSVVHVGRGVQSDPGVPVFVCLPAEEVVAEHPGVLDAAEGLGGVWPGVALGNAHIWLAVACRWCCGSSPKSSTLHQRPGSGTRRPLTYRSADA